MSKIDFQLHVQAPSVEDYLQCQKIKCNISQCFRSKRQRNYKIANALILSITNVIEYSSVKLPISPTTVVHGLQSNEHLERFFVNDSNK